jgi:hypothetical protein
VEAHQKLAVETTVLETGPDIIAWGPLPPSPSRGTFGLLKVWFVAMIFTPPLFSFQGFMCILMYFGFLKVWYLMIAYFATE